MDVPRVFLSYRRADAGGHARAVHRELCRRFDPGFAFFDRASIESGVDFPERLRTVVEGCAVALVLIGRDWIDARDPGGRRRLEDPSDFVRLEVALALAVGKTVVPVLLDDTPMPGEGVLPKELAPLIRRDAFTLRGKAYEYDRNLEDLVKTLARLTGVAPRPDNLGVAIDLGDDVAVYRQLEYLPVRLRAALREAFRPLIEDRQRWFGGRRDAIDRVMSFVSGVEAGYAVVTAPAGFGKTALVATVVAGTPDAFGYHFFTPLYGEDTLSEVFFLRNVLEQMAAWHGEVWDLPRTVDELRAAYHRVLDTPLPGPGVLVLDGIDEVQGWTLAPFLSRRLPRGLRIVATVRDVGQDWREQFRFPADQVTEIGLRGLDRGEVAAVLGSVGARGAACVSDRAVSDAVFALAGGSNEDGGGADPFYVRFLVEDLAQGRLGADTLATAPRGLDGYLEQWWQDIRRHAGDEPARDLFGTLSVALGPLAREELEAINPSLRDAWLADRFDEVLARVRRLVVRDAAGGYSLVHPRLHEYVQRKTRPETFRTRLLEFCRSWRAGHRYALANYGAHLAEAGEWSTLRDLVATAAGGRSFLEMRRDGGDSGFLRDLERAWRHAEDLGVSDRQSVGDQVRCALVASSIRTMSGRLTPGLMVAAVRHGCLSVRAALDEASAMPDPERRVAALAELWPHLNEAQRIRASEASVAGAAAIRTDTRRPPIIVFEGPAPPTRDLDRRGDILEPLASKLSGTSREAALRLIRDLDRPDQIPRLLTALATGLPAAEREALIDEALEAVERIKPRSRIYNPMMVPIPVRKARALAGMAVHLDEPRCSEVARMAVERAMKAPAGRAIKALVELLPRLPAAVASEAAERIVAAPRGGNRDAVRALVAASPLLVSSSARASVVAEIRTLIAAGPSAFDAAMALSTILPLVPEADRRAISDEAWSLASRIEDDAERSEAAAHLAAQATEPLRSHALQVAADAAGLIDDEETWVTAVARLLPLRGARDHRAVLDRGARLADEADRVRLFDAVAPLLTRDAVAEALTLVRTIGDEARYAPAQEGDDPAVRWKGEASDEDDPDFYAVPRPTLAEARAIEFDLERVAGLASLAPTLAADERAHVLTEAFRDALKINDRQRRHAALRIVARPLADAEREGIDPLWRAALRAGAARVRADLISDLDALRPLVPIVWGPEGEPAIAGIVDEIADWFP